MPRTIFFISDGTGITAETLGHTLLTQFEGFEYRQITLPFIETPGQAAWVVNAINRAHEEDGARPIVFTTLIDLTLLELVEGSNALVLDLFSPFIRPLEAELSKSSIHVKGRSHGIVDKASYDVRIEAINFALNHDDGASTRPYFEADIILVGVSRTGKTPTCIYLAMQFGVRAANYPLAEEDLGKMCLPRAMQPFRSRIYGLTINPDRLHMIRTVRRPESSYASLAQCKKEVWEAEKLFRTEGIAFLNTTSISIEEIAAHVLQKMGLKRRLF